MAGNEVISRPDWSVTPSDGSGLPAAHSSSVPTRAGAYDMAGLSTDAADLPALDAWADFAAHVGLSQREFSQAAAFIQRTPPALQSEDSFIETAVRLGWSDGAIQAALGFAAVVRQLGGVPVHVDADSTVAAEIGKAQAVLREDRRRYHAEGWDRRLRQLLALQAAGG